MGTDRGRIQAVQVPVDLSTRVGAPLQRLQDTRPDAVAFPSTQPGIHRGPRTEVVGEIPPGTPGAQAIQDAVEDQPVIPARPTSGGTLRRQQRLQAGPLLVGYGVNTHPLSLPASFHTRPSS